MKHTGLYILGGITFALLGGMAYYEYRKQQQASIVAATQQAIADSGTTAELMKFRGFNFDQLLNKTTKHALAEITALQRMINAYYDGEQTIDVTGVFDTQTANAVKDITNKSSTTLHEFNFQYLVKKRGQKVANDLITSMTITGNS